MSRQDPQTVIRFPAELKERIRRSAAESRRSMNSEIVFLLERALPTEPNENVERADAR